MIGSAMSLVGLKRRNRAATSLIEVLVVMVILLISIFAIIRVFPLGFQYLKNAEYRSLAVRLSNQELERIRNDDENLPESITFSYYNGTVRQTVAGFSPDYDLLSEADKTSALDKANGFYRDINLYRYVTGERVRVPLPSLAAGVAGSIYTIKLGPVYMDPSFGDPTTAPAGAESFLKVTGAPMTGTSAESDNGTANANQFNGFLRTVNNYVIDYGGESGKAWILFPRADHDRRIEITYSYEIANNVKSVQDYPIFHPSQSEDSKQPIVPAGYFGWIEIRRPDGTSDGTPVLDISPGSETVKQQFTRLPSGTIWDTDNPYQYKLVQPNIPDGGAGTTFANIGMLAFNPVGATFNEGGQAFSAYIDYAVLDWHIIRDDREVPSVTAGSAGDVPIRLSLGKIKIAGDDNIDGTLYDGVFPSTSQTANSDIVVVRLDTGSLVTRGDFANRATTDATAGFWVNNEGHDNTYGSGVIYLNTNQIPKGTPLRIMYKGDGDWGISLQKACANYKPSLTTAGAYELHPPLTPTNHDADPTTDKLPLGDSAQFGVLSQSGAEYLVFNESELNKSVAAIFEYTDTGGALVRTAPIQFTIGSETDLDTTDDASATVPWRFATADITRYMPGRDIAKPWRIVGTIKGVSIKSRAIWKDETTRKARWRVQDLDSYLTRSTAQ